MNGRSRGVSTVLDATFCLLLVSAAALTVATADTARFAGAVDHDHDRNRDEAVAETLATATATVRYDLGTDRRTGATVERVRHGTLAELLAAAARATVAVDGRGLDPHGERFAAAVRAVVAPVLDGRTQVVAVWTPYPGAHVRGRVAVGPTPPPDASVHAATLTVDSGLPPTQLTTENGYRDVAAVVAERTVDGLVPARRTRVALAGDSVDGTVARVRFERASAVYGVETTLDAGVTPASDDLTAAVSTRVHSELREQFATPRAAADAVRTDRVTVVVRTWP